MPRSLLEKYWPKKWFEDFVVGAFVRISIGVDPATKQLKYRICEVVKIGEPAAKLYPLGDHKCDIRLNLRYGTAAKDFEMKDVSNSAFDDVGGSLTPHIAIY